MKVEAWVFGALAVFFVPITPIYYVISRDLTGTAALTLTVFLCFMVAAYLGLVARRMELRPEDKKLGEIAEGAGELGFFPPQSIWPLYCAVAFSLVCMGPVFGWWLSLLGLGMGAFSIMGLVYQYYKGEHAH